LQNGSQPSESQPGQQRIVAGTQMSFVKNLNQYNLGVPKYKPPSSPKMNQIHKMNMSEHPAADKDGDDDDMAADEDCDIQVPVTNFRSNYISQKVIDSDFTSATNDKLSPTAKVGGVRTLI